MRCTNEELKTVLQLKAEGLTNKAIGQKLNRSESAITITLVRLRSIENLENCTDLRARLSAVNKKYRDSHLAQTTESCKRWYDKNRRGRCSNIHRSENYRECCNRKNETRRNRNIASVEEAKNHRRYWTTRDVELLASMHRNNVKYREMAKALGRSEKAIDRALHRFGLTKKGEINESFR